MFKRILLYFMFFICLLTKEEIALAIDFVQGAADIAMHCEVPVEDVFEGEDAPEDWWNHAPVSTHILPHPMVNLGGKVSFPSRNESILNVLIEQTSPPPRIA
jgi:hypothetical protein